MSNSSESDLLNIFWIEVSEHLESLNAALLKVEMASDEETGSLLREMNRVAHSMKGAARAVGINLIETISHYMEEVFSAAQDNGLKLTPEVCDSLYDGLDLIQNVADGEENNTEALSAVIANLEQLVVQTAAGTSNGAASDTPEVVSTAQKPVSHTRAEDIRMTPSIEMPAVSQVAVKPPEKLDSQTVVIRSAEEMIRVPVRKLDGLMAEASEMLVAKMHGEERQNRITELRKLHLRWQREWRSVRASYIRLVRRVQESGGEAAPEQATLFKFLEANQRYLTETNRQLTQLAQIMAQDNMQLSALADQLQDDIGAMRMMPFDSIVGGFQRMVRDLARDTGKQVSLDIFGVGVEIDKTVLDALKDPIMHLLRNAVDHGLETAAEREQAGKAPTGRVELSIEQRGSEIIVRIGDDGRGVDPEKVRQAAIKNGVLTEQEAAAINNDDMKSYIFQSGLSTMEQVTALSGRGVGMDVVRDRVEGLRGRVSLESVLGEGTTVILNVPVSLTRIRCILLQVGSENYAVPSAMVARMETLPRAQVFTAEGRNTLLLNDQPMPLVSMGAILDIPMLEATEESETVQVVGLRGADREVAFEVDMLHSERELVLKPLGPELARAPYVAGAALLGSGDVIIVLDANDLVRKASGSALPRRRINVYSSLMERRIRVLVVDDSITTRTLEKNILETAGFEVHVAIDGVEAWRILGDIDPDIVITDIEMPNMNGLDLTRQIKENGHTQHIPVILLTSLGKPEQREAGLRAGADAYLVKSRFDQGELLQMIQAVI